MRLLIIFGILGLSFAHADDARPVDCRILWFVPGSPPADLVHALRDGSEQPLEIPGQTLSAVIRCFASDNSIRFMNKDDGSLAALARVPAGVTDAILVFLPGTASSDAPRWRVMVVDSATGNFPPGGAFVVNLYKNDIRFMIGEHRIQLRPGKSEGVDRPDQRDDFNMAPTSVQFQYEGRWRTASESNVRFIPELRYLILAYVDPRSGRPRIATFNDTKPIGVAAAE